MSHTIKGKQATKGAKQIVLENLGTLSFYRNMALVSSLPSLVSLIVYFSTLSTVLYIFSSLIFICSYQFMVYISRAQYTETGQLIDSGVDLNMEGGLAEHVKDIIILTTICQVLSSIISNYFWYVWLFAPARGLWIVWKNILSPFFFQETPSQPEEHDKKQRKLERKMKKMQR